MPSNYTPNYNLNQWEADDRVLRTDFNADNAKIDAALQSLKSSAAALEQRVAFLERVVPNLAYYAGQLALTAMSGIKRQITSQAVICEIFDGPGLFTLSGAATISDNALKVTGKGATGTLTTPTYALSQKNWTQAKIWIHQSTDGVTPKLNGTALPRTAFDSGVSVLGKRAYEFEYTYIGKGSSNATVTLELNTGNHSALEVYDLAVFFF